MQNGYTPCCAQVMRLSVCLTEVDVLLVCSPLLAAGRVQSARLALRAPHVCGSANSSAGAAPAGGPRPDPRGLQRRLPASIASKVLVLVLAGEDSECPSVLFSVQLVESVPVGLYPSSPPSRPSIANGWLRLLDEANSSVHIAAFYLTLRNSDVQSSDPSDSQVRVAAIHQPHVS